MALSLALENTRVEKDVENFYRKGISRAFKTEIESPFSCDGFLKSGKTRLLMEFKLDMDFQSKTEICKVLIQTLYYMKRFEKETTSVPNVYIIADKNEIIIENVNPLLPYLTWDLDWTIAPCTAYVKNQELLMHLINNTDVVPFVHRLADVDFKVIKAQIENKSSDSPFRIPVNPHNLPLIFNCFKESVLDKTSLNANQLASMFIQLLIDPANNYLHPGKKNLLVTENYGSIKVKSQKYESFFAHFKKDYTPLEKDELTSSADRIIEEETRRRQGEFFTPAIWADEAHKMLSESLGENWKNEYVVWDCASGTCNLTRDYQFAELYCSTLNQCDIETANAMGYGGTKFQYDFLNDDSADSLGEKVPEGLRKAFEEGKKVLFLMNPPYGTSANLDIKGGENKAGISKNKINSKMVGENYGLISRNLYAQFIYKISVLKNKYSDISMAIYCPPLFMTSENGKKLRDLFYSVFSFEDGMLFEAGNFADVKSQWGISFTIWGNGEKKGISLRLKALDANDFEIEEIGIKPIFATTKNPLRWIKDDTKTIENIEETPHMSSALKVSDKSHMKAKKNSIGSYISLSNSVEKNNIAVALFSGIGTQGNGSVNTSILPVNVDRVLSLFAARKLIQPNWINCKDEYMVPNEEHENYQQWLNDCHVYSLFDNASNQSSLRQIEYKEKLWDIKNEFFWMTKQEMMNLANENHYDSMYQDAKNDTERFMSKKLQEINLSDDAKAVLEAATNLVKKSIAMRKIYSEDHPEYHLDTWDAGYAQLKMLWKEYFKEEFKAFRDLWKAFQDRMRPQVYELGFLKEG